MNNLTALIVDDEEDGRSTLRCYLEQYCPHVATVGEAASVEEAVLAIQAHVPDIVFLDINMPYANGFTLFDYFPQPRFNTIFVTAHNSYALQAIKRHALDYLLKPVDIDELISAVQHATKQAARVEAETLHTHSQPANPIRVNPQHQKWPDKIALPILDGFLFVRPDDIIRCEAKKSYTQIYFTARPQLTVCRALGQYELLLSPYGFIRIHNQHLINTAHVERYQRGRGGSVIMSDKTEVVISHRRKDDFLALINGGRL